jgi:hypothetical protein
MASPAAGSAEASAGAGEDVKTFSELPEDVRAILLRVADILDTISFGTVLMVVQDSKVVQIEMAEKYRLR